MVTSTISINRGLFILLSFAIGSCGGGSGAPATADVATADFDVAQSVYGVTPSLPSGFYRDSEPYPDRQTFTVHIKSAEVLSGHSGVNYELCSDDFSEALSWSDINAQAQGFSTTLTGTFETDWYFQFDRAIDAGEPAMLINRAFKCAQLDRSALSDAGVAGFINRRPLDPDDLRWIAEYLWGFSPYNNALNAVVSSTGRDGESRLEHEILRASATRFSGTDGCDVVEIWSMQYTADRSTGQLQLHERFVRKFEARYGNGQVEICGG